MANLTAAKRKGMSKKQFAGPGKSFPINDAEHAKLAIGGATRAERAGNISPSEEAGIKSKARAKLGSKGATDGMGRGKGGWAVHSTAAPTNMHNDASMHKEKY